MEVMSILRQKGRELVAVYDHVLEQQILERGSYLACWDEKLQMEMEEMLKQTGALDAHCLGLDPLRVMEVSLNAAAASAPAAATYKRRIKPRGGLQALAKAFEVLEQAALNLYLGPWREEYRVIKMYSGTFTHYIQPVLSMPQIEKLFGLLGYQISPSRPEQLCLELSKISPPFLTELLRLSCAFFVARCECRLLLSALGKHAGNAKWELSLVKERKRADNLEVALEKTKRTFELNESEMELNEDLYTGEPVNAGHGEMVAFADESPRSLVGLKSNAVESHSYSTAYSPTSSPDSDMVNTSSVIKSKHLSEEPLISRQMEELGLSKAKDVPQTCSCLRFNPPLLLHRCCDCNTFHDITCHHLSECHKYDHKVDSLNSHREKEKESDEGLTCTGAMKEKPNHLSKPSLAVSDEAETESSPPPPISFHTCCSVVSPLPDIVCHRCNVFHHFTCKEATSCTEKHNATRLAKCSCGSYCSRKPLVLCRFCGREFCRNCWYKDPLVCTCGQMFDQSTFV